MSKDVGQPVRDPGTPAPRPKEAATLIIHRGKLVADGTPSDLQASFSGGQQVSFGVLGEAVEVAEVLGNWDKVKVLEKHVDEDDGVQFTLVSDDADDIRPQLFSLAVEKGWTLTELHREQANLEDVDDACRQRPESSRAR